MLRWRLAPAQLVRTASLRRVAAGGPHALRRAERLWTSLEVPELMGLDLDRYKWRQNQARRTLVLRALRRYNARDFGAVTPRPRARPRT